MRYFLEAEGVSSPYSFRDFTAKVWPICTCKSLLHSWHVSVSQHTSFIALIVQRLVTSQSEFSLYMLMTQTISNICTCFLSQVLYWQSSKCWWRKQFQTFAPASCHRFSTGRALNADDANNFKHLHLLLAQVLYWQSSACLGIAKLKEAQATRVRWIFCFLRTSCL
jgi:hypothetical protein